MATLTEIKRQIDGTMASNVKQMAQMFIKLADTNQEAALQLIRSMYPRIADNEEKIAAQLYYHLILADNIAETFDYS